ncbi:MAG: hypothetical protein FWH48_07550 [Oscillospiraceae bacterium]|nr:hypothetical protein [Oscillospiraceae bacterium]
MKTAILYYSRSGNTKALAAKKAEELGADIEELIEIKKTLMLVGLFRSMRRKKTEIQPIKLELDDYEKIIIMSPVWAGHPVSAINSVIERLPAGKKVELIMVSTGGGTNESAEGTKALVAKQGCEVVGYTDLKAKRNNGDVIAEVIE